MEKENKATILGKMITLASPAKLPESFSENCKRIWEAFRAGEAYQRLKSNTKGGEPLG